MGYTKCMLNATFFFIEIARTKAGKWEIMYLCVMDIDFASFYDFDIWIFIVPTVVVFVFHFILTVHVF
jgi:hypothetical protein